MTTALRTHRRAKGLSQPQLARAVGCSQPSIVNYELGRTFPSDPKVQRALRDLFGMPLTALLAPEPENANGDDPRAAAASKSPERVTTGRNHRVDSA